MAFVRHPSLGLSTRLLLSRATGTPSITLLSLRHFSASRRTLQAQPAHKSSDDSTTHIKSPRLETGVYSAGGEPGKYVNPYEGGQSALEKAAHLFFFTEIVRGNVAAYVTSTVSESPSQACG
jgi:NADH dehydrogenase (ubiquinone) Fe-S protein 8